MRKLLNINHRQCNTRSRKPSEKKCVGKHVMRSEFQIIAGE